MRKILMSIAIIFLVAMINVASASAAQSARWSKQENPDKFPREVLRLVNLERARIGEPPLKFARDLSASAYVRAKELPIKFSHTRPDGSKCFTAMPQIGHIIGENLAGGQTSPEQVVEAWMNSKTHRENILSKNFREIGVAYYYNPDSKYKYYWVQHFRG